jgi:hypothetical protein
MNSLKQRLFTNWHLVRIMRLAIGTMLLVEGIRSREWAIGLFSVFFLYQAITDTGCCGSQGCYTTPDKASLKKQDVTTEVEYEEVK